MTEPSYTKKIKLLFCIDFIYTNTAGTENQLIKIINNLDHNKYEIHLLCLRNTSWLEENRAMINCPVTAFNYNEHNHGDPRNFITFFKTILFMKKVKPDIMLAFFKVSYIMGVIAARLAGIKIIISTRRDFGLWLDGRGIHLLKFANRFTHSIITNSIKVKELTCREEVYEAAKVHVIYNGLDLQEFKPSTEPIEAVKVSYGIPGQNMVVGILAGLRHMKNHNTFLAAAKRVLDIRSDVSFVIVGDGPLRARLEDDATALGIKDNVYFLGWKTDISRQLSMMNIGVNCSLSEGLSNAIMEYMAAGLPCIVSDGGGNTELIENGVNGFVFPVDDDCKLAELIIILLNDSDKCREFATISRKRIQSQLTVEKMTREYDQYFDETWKMYAN